MICKIPIMFCDGLWIRIELVYLCILIYFKITCIPLKQAISLNKKMVVLSANFTILMSLSLIYIPLILVSALMKLASTLASILYKSMESRHPWKTNIRVKGSDRRPFILILDSILVYATLII